MNTLLDKIKTVLKASRDGGGVLNYLPAQAIKFVAPGSIPPLRNDQFPFIGIAPKETSETWITSAKREAFHVVELYCARIYRNEEEAIEKLVDFLDNVLSVVRNERFDSYLDKPAQPMGIDYVTTPYGDNIYIIVATIRLECRRIFLSTLP